jgi:predicted DNA-binding transcriptional regulator YafY
MRGETPPWGGYRMRAGMRLPPLMLSDEEAAAVAIGLVIAGRRGVGAADSALVKITASCRTG